MIKKIQRILSKLNKKFPDCEVVFAPNIQNQELVDFFIHFDEYRKYIKISIIKEKIDKININLLIQEIERRINKQYYGSEMGIVVFDEFTNEKGHIPRLD